MPKRWQIQIVLTCQGEFVTAAHAYVDLCIFEAMERTAKGADTGHALCLEAGPFAYHLGFAEVEDTDEC